MNVLTATPQEAPKNECSPVKLEEPTSPSTTTPVPMAPEVLRGILPQPLFGQFPYPNAAMAQILAAHAAQAHAVQGLAFPAVPMFPAGIPEDFKPNMLMGGAPGPMPLFLGDNSHLFHPYALDGMKKRNATREATAPLKEWLHAHRKNPYPSKGDKVILAMQTRMSLTQVSTWFANARRRLKKENKMTWSPQNRRGDGCDEDDDEDDEDLNRPSSSTSITSDRKEGLLGKPHLASPTPSGGSSEDLVTPKKHDGSPSPPQDMESPKRKPKMWSIADVTSDEDSKKDSSPPSSDENLNGALFQSAMKKQIELMSRMDPNLFRHVNPFMLQFFAAQAQQQVLAAPPPPPLLNEAGLMSQAEETSSPSPSSSSPRSHQG